MVISIVKNDKNENENTFLTPFQSNSTSSSLGKEEMAPFLVTAMEEAFYAYRIAFFNG